MTEKKIDYVIINCFTRNSKEVGYLPKLIFHQILINLFWWISISTDLFITCTDVQKKHLD